MREERVLELHNNILDYLLQYRSQHPDFTFQTRVNNRNERLKKGYWFQGTEDYIFVPLYHQGCSDNKTKTIGFVVKEDGEYIEIVFRKIVNGSEDDLKFHQELMEYLKSIDLFKKIEEKSSKQYFFWFKNNNLEENLNFYITTFKKKADELIEKYELQDRYMISNEKFLSNIQKINQFRNQKLNPNMLNRYEEAYNKFLDSIEVNDLHEERGLVLYTFDRQAPFYVYKNKRNTIYTKPQNGNKEFTQAKEKILRYLDGQTIRSDQDKSYVEPIGEYIKKFFLKSGEYTMTKNIMLYGVPGIGKTHNTKKLIYFIESRKDEKEIFDTIRQNDHSQTDISEFEARVSFITFHQSFGYEDFIEGFRPNENGQIELVDGLFKRLCEKARDDKAKNYYLVIDEINRGNISKIFGELITLIEEDKRDTYEVTLPYSKEKLSVPSNLYIIGTMNSTDKSIALIDVALRRRFTFLKMEPKEDLVADIAKDVFRKLNNILVDKLGKDHLIGHSYFMNIESAEDLEFVKEYKIKPLLEEYFYGDENGLDEVLSLIT